LHGVVFLSVHTLKVDVQEVGEAEVRENHQFPSRARFRGSGDNLLFCQHLLNQLGTRVSHTKVARSRLVDLLGILLPYALWCSPSFRWLLAQSTGPLPCSGSALM
jgi:hypothetical protein